MNTRRDVGLILAAELDNIGPSLVQMQAPYERASEMTRRVELAKAFLEEQFNCLCNTFPLGSFQRIEECARCHLTRILDGDI